MTPWVLLLVPLFLAAPARAQGDAEAARRAAEAAREAAAREADLARAAEILAERLAAERTASAARLQALEAEVIAATERVGVSEAAEAEARQDGAKLAREMEPLLPPLLRLAAEPAPLLLAAPLPPGDVALSLVALRGMLAEAASLSARLREAESRAAREAASGARERRRLEEARGAARDASAALDRQIEAARAQIRASTAAERVALARAEREIARARSIEEALARIERQREAEEQRREQAEARARRAAPPQAAPPQATPAPPAAREPEPAPASGGAPVAGTLVRGFAAPGDGGPARGLTYATPPGARVTSPCGGPVAFAGPFRSFGRLVIVDCGGGVHLVLAGMDRLDVAMGRRIRSGEPVGVMAREGRPTLYVELRRRGEAVDPRPFLRGG
ncbi:murein hydrolase activator EnvC family protein [Sabulicella rubraurantiaca]|uniref:murein hydrolase activator EnvC family protein n=1 Tax=Sabulicella rubraurantiaca TaxID=2811429 RepID=UPI001A95B587|nr:peptidoglycan DD-metalloendopeptidase family protein [Sabulicella rubraurantiaca]